MSKWIPCSEKLPKESGAYLCTTRNAFDKYESVDVEVLWFNRGKWIYVHDEFGDLERDDVTAWMPLPEPWEGESDE